MSQLTVIYRQRNALLLRIAELNNRGYDVEESIVMLLQTCNEYSDLRRRQQQARSERAALVRLVRLEQQEVMRREQQDARMRQLQIEATPIKEKMLAKAELNAPMAEECGICLEKHIMKDSVTTSCDHHFGKDCFQQWYTTCRMNALGVRCPTCRTNNPKTNGYRECEAPVQKPGVILNPEVVLIPRAVLIPRVQVQVPASAVVVLNPDVVRIPRIRVPASVVVVLNPGVVLIPRVRVPASVVV